MKKTFMMLLALVGLAACSNDKDEIQPSGKLAPMSFGVSFENNETRSVLNSDKTVSFQAGDEIKIFYEGAQDADTYSNHGKKFTTTAGGATATFTGEAETGKPKYWALYPYQADAYKYEVGYDVIVLETKMYQTATAGSFDPTANVCIAESTDGKTFEMKNVCSLVKFCVPAGKIYKKARIFSKGLFFCYKGSYKPCNGELYYADTKGANVYLTGTIEGGNDYYIAVAPVTAASGLEFYLYENESDDEATGYAVKKTTSNSVTFNRSKILNLGVIE